MSKLLKSINTRVVGVSFRNDAGTERQEILSGLSVGEAMLLEYFEYENEPAYAVTDVLGNRIGSLSKELAADIYKKYKDCYFAVQIWDITGGDVGQKYGCVIDIDIYDTVPEIIKQSTPVTPTIENETPVVVTPANSVTSHSHPAYGTIFIVLGIVLVLVGLLLLLAVPVGGILAIAGGIFSVVLGKGYRKS